MGRFKLTSSRISNLLVAYLCQERAMVALVGTSKTTTGGIRSMDLRVGISLIKQMEVR